MGELKVKKIYISKESTKKQKNRNLFMRVKDTEDIVKRSNLNVDGVLERR